MVPIAFSGKAGVGKTTTADLIETLTRPLGLYCTAFSFAKQLRIELAKELDVSPDLLYAKKMELKGKTVREHLISFGNRKRQEDPAYWVKKLLNDNDFSLNILDKKSIPIIDDVRFKNEHEALRKMNAFIVRLDPFPEWPSSCIDPNDPSETDLDDCRDWDLVITPVYTKNSLFGPWLTAVKVIENYILTRRTQ